MDMALVFIAIFLSVVLFRVLLAYRRHLRAQYIRAYAFPRGLFDKFAGHHPGLALKDHQLVLRGLRQFFLAHLESGQKFVSMPSQAADDMWHEFILYTRDYQRFCNKAFGKFLHHTPAVVLTGDKQNNTGLRRVWYRCCKEENIDPRKPTRLPLLFALDEKLNVKSGFRYAVDCSGFRDKNQKDKKEDGGSGGAVYCGGDMSDSSFDGSTDGFGDGDGGGDGGDGGGDGGGCGGD